MLRRLYPLFFLIFVATTWSSLLYWLAPELLDEMGLTHLVSSPRVQAEKLAHISSEVDRVLASLIGKTSSGINLIRHHEDLQAIHGVHWKHSQLEIEFPPACDVEAITQQIESLAFDDEWKVEINTYHVEPLSFTIQIVAMGYPTHLLTLYPTLSQVPPITDDTKKKCRIAILIDDMGYSRNILNPLWSLEQPFSVAILPFTPYALAIAEKANMSQKEVLVHLPLEPLHPPARSAPSQNEDTKEITTTAKAEKLPLGQLTLSMTLEEIRSRTLRALRSVPYAVGVNNHQGSAFMQDRSRTRAMLEVVKKEGIYFVDSRTISHSVGFSTAHSLEIPATSRQVFIDNDPDPEKIRYALGRLKSTAVRNGSALGIGHPRPTTVEVLREWLTRTEKEGFELVFVSTLTEQDPTGE